MSDSDRNTDPSDQASELEEVMRSSAISMIAGKAKPQQSRRPDGSWPHPDCEDCGEPIPEQRLEMGKIKCVWCQANLERGVRR